MSVAVTGEATERARKCLPVSENQSNGKDAKMTFSSTYRDTFKGEQPPPCPTADLTKVTNGQQTSSGLQLVGMKNGHHMYRMSKDSSKDSHTNVKATTVAKVMSNGDCNQSESAASVKVAKGAAAATDDIMAASGQKRAAIQCGSKSAKVSRGRQTVDSKRLTTP